MTYAEVYSMIEGIGLPSAYYQFPKGTGQEPPFICFFYTGNDDLGADDENYSTIKELVIELYTDTKDFETESTVETALRAAGLYFSKDETQIDSEQMYMVTYSTQIVITE